MKREATVLPKIASRAKAKGEQSKADEKACERSEAGSKSLIAHHQNGDVCRHLHFDGSAYEKEGLVPQLPIG